MITLLAQNMANQANQGSQASHALTLTSMVRDFTRMNPLMFHSSKVEEDPQEFINEMYQILAIIGVSSMKKSELAAYKLKRLSQI